MTIKEILARYEKESLDLENAGYSPLQCAVYDGDEAHIQAMFEYYEANNILKAELSRVSPVDQTGENILQIAMKHYSVLELCCKFIEKVDPMLFTTLIQHVDADKDSVFHQIAEFGRSESLKVLMPYLDKYVDPYELENAFSSENKHQETATEIVANYDKSKTVMALKEANILSAAHLAEVHQNLPNIQQTFEEYPVLNRADRLAC